MLVDLSVYVMIETKKMLKTKHMKRLATILSLLGALAFQHSATQAQFTQQGSKLVGTGAVGGAEQGVSVSL